MCARVCVLAWEGRKLTRAHMPTHRCPTKTSENQKDSKRDSEGHRKRVDSERLETEMRLEQENQENNGGRPGVGCDGERGPERERERETREREGESTEIREMERQECHRDPEAPGRGEGPALGEGQKAPEEEGRGRGVTGPRGDRATTMAGEL